MSSALRGRTVVITRPVGTAAAMAQRVRAAGGMPVLLPGMSLRACDAPGQATLDVERVIFTSPAAVRFASGRVVWPNEAVIVAVGRATAAALRRRGIGSVLVPARQDSEGVLDLPALQHVRGLRIALIGAAGGRGLMGRQLAARGAQLGELHVYRRLPPRLDRRHRDALENLPAHPCVLFSSVAALHYLHDALPDRLWTRLCDATAVVSSERLGAAASAAGFSRLAHARSALAVDLLQAAAELS